MQTLIWSQLNTSQKAAALSRPSMAANVDVSEVLENVRTQGDKALLSYTEKFDGVKLQSLKVPQEKLKTAWDNLPAPDKAAMHMAKANIETYHKAQMPKTIHLETMSGVMCSREPRPLDSAGLYVPGGTAPLLSSLMMLAIPAKIAGVKKIIVTTPPQKDGEIADVLLACAYMCGVEHIYRVGGAQAIAALAYGTETIPKVVKIFGPGNAYVAAAKAQLATKLGGPAIDLPAGPSEVMVLADDTANPAFIAADLLAQAEHDVLAQVICICRSSKYAKNIQTELNAQLKDLPRKDIASQALQHGRILVVDGANDMLDIVNLYAPEHLIVQTKNPQSLMPKIRNAGSVFLGPWTPESVGDYASGTNHTLPTYGAAKAYSGIVLESFMKFISVQTLTRGGLAALGPSVERLAQMEGLEAHRRAVSIRLESDTIS